MEPTSSAAAADDGAAALAESADSALRPVIAASWQRSSACGVPLGEKAELPYNQGFDPDSRLMRAARPVLDRLVVTLADTSTSVLLADRQARIIQRWVGDNALYTAMDRADAAPGFGFAEEFAGTNGVGTVLEESRPVAVRGEEHYAEFLRHLSCVGVPIHHPITRGIEGILDITCLACDYNPLMPPLLVEAVRHIETRLTQLSAPSEVALLEEFVRSCRNHRGAVVGVSPAMIFTNPAAVEHLTPQDQAVLWDVACRLMAAGRSEGSADLARGRFRVRCQPVSTDAREPRGVVLRLAPVEAHPPRVPRSRGHVTVEHRAVPPSLPGRSPQWRQVMARIQGLAEQRQPVAITGEPGTGKLRLARHLHELSDPGCGLRVFDAAPMVDSAADGPAVDLVDRVCETLRIGDAVILRRIDQLPPGSLNRLTVLAEHGPVRPVARRAGRLIVTARTTADTPQAVERALACFPHQVWVPPLRQHADDIADLVPALLAELSGEHGAQATLPALQVLLRTPWPGNVAELRDTLAAALAASPGREIQPQHLPASVLKRAHQRLLSTLERSQRDLIIETLASVANNRTEAARILGIGRATLYRKMRSLGISTGQELVR